MSRASPRFRRINALLPSLSGQTAFRITPSGVIDSQLWLWNVDYIWTGGSSPNAAAETNLATNWIANVATALKAVMTTDVQWTAVKVTCLTLNGRIPVTNTTSASLGFGTVVGSHYDSVIAGIITKYTSTKGQHGRGRNYIAGVPLSFVTPGTDPNRLNTTGFTAYQALATALTTVVSDGTNNYMLGLTMRTHGGAAATNGQVQSITFPRLLLGTVRRRRLGRGK